MVRKSKATHLAMCPATHADLAHRPGSIVTGSLFSPEVAGPGIPMEATAHQYQLDVGLLAFAGAPALRDRICTLIGAARRQVNTWARHALGLGLTDPVRHQDVQPVLARVLSALIYECSQPSPKARARGLRFAEPVDGVQPAGPDELPILSFDDPDPTGPPVQVAAAPPAAPVAPAPAADVLPVLSGMTAKALAAELASYGIPEPKGPKARLVEVVRLARVGRAQSATDASAALMDLDPPGFQTPTAYAHPAAAASGGLAGIVQLPRVEDMPVEVMHAELRARGVMISGDRGTVARVLRSMREDGPPPALALR